MKIENINIRNFRNHEDLTLTFDKDVTFIVGPNGSGKTNILEAIHLLSTTKSPRAKHDRDVINYNQNFCTLNGRFNIGEETTELNLQIIKSDKFENASSKKAKVNKVAKSLSRFCGIFNTVLFTPEDIEIITGSPSGRRKYIDFVLFQTSSEYKRDANQYMKILKQRNKILELIREEGRGYDQMEYWTEQLIKYGKSIQRQRTHMFDYLSKRLKEKSKDLNDGKVEFDIAYSPNEISKERIEEYGQREIYAKATLVGPHRDDFTIFMNGKDVSNFASRGQQRSAMLSLKLSEIEYFEMETNEKPVLLLDDILSELDKRHREAVFEVIGKNQTILTDTEALESLNTSNIQIVELTL